jgi:hypothetical protein
MANARLFYTRAAREQTVREHRALIGLVNRMEPIRRRIKTQRHEYSDEQNTDA